MKKRGETLRNLKNFWKQVEQDYEGQGHAEVDRSAVVRVRFRLNLRHLKRLVIFVFVEKLTPEAYFLDFQASPKLYGGCPRSLESIGLKTCRNCSLKVKVPNH